MTWMERCAFFSIERIAVAVAIRVVLWHTVGTEEKQTVGMRCWPKVYVLILTCDSSMAVHQTDKAEQLEEREQLHLKVCLRIMNGRRNDEAADIEAYAYRHEAAVKARSGAGRLGANVLTLWIRKDCRPLPDMTPDVRSDGLFLPGTSLVFVSYRSTVAYDTAYGLLARTEGEIGSELRQCTRCLARCLKASPYRDRTSLGESESSALRRFFPDSHEVGESECIGLGSDVDGLSSLFCRCVARWW